MLDDLLDEIKEIVFNFFKTIWRRCKYIIIIAITVFIVIEFLKIEVKNPTNIESQEVYIFGISISNIGQVVTLITFPVTAIWAFYHYKKNRRVQQQEKAGEIAKEFSNNIVEDLSIVNEVVQRSFLSKYIPNDKIDEKLKYFNVIEVRELYNNDDIVTEYKTLLKSKGKILDNIYHLVLYKMNNNMDFNEFIEYGQDAETKSKDWKIIDEYIKTIDKPYHFLTFERKVLNQLEYLCMDIASKAADSVFIFQSLHQMFLKSIRNLYFDISVLNINSVDKLYTNIIFVYNEWKRMYKENLKIERRRNVKRHEENNFEIRKI